jgi:hypothetical protein
MPLQVEAAILPILRAPGTGAHWHGGWIMTRIGSIMAFGLGCRPRSQSSESSRVLHSSCSGVSPGAWPTGSMA